MEPVPLQILQIEVLHFSLLNFTFLQAKSHISKFHTSKFYISLAQISHQAHIPGLLEGMSDVCVCTNNQRTGSPRYYAKSPSAQDAFQPIMTRPHQLSWGNQRHMGPGTPENGHPRVKSPQCFWYPPLKKEFSIPCLENFTSPCKIPLRIWQPHAKFLEN